jgi:hypothetical protein
MSTTTTPTHVWRPSSARRLVLDGFLPVPRGTLPAEPLSLTWPVKDPSDVLDYEFDIAAALVGNEGDSITTVGVSISPNGAGDLALNSVAVDGSTIVLWFAAGQAGTVYIVQITVATTNGRTIGRSALLPVQTLATTTAPASSLTTDQGAIITDQNGDPILLGS